MPTIAGIDVRVEWDRYRKGSGERGPYVVKSFLVAWDDVDDFVNGVLGSASLRGGPGGTVERVAPNTPEESPNLRAIAVDVEGVEELGPNGTIVPAFGLGRCIVNYGPPSWDALPADDPNGYNQLDPQNPIAYAMQEIDWSDEQIRVPGSAYKFLGSPQIKLDADDFGVTVHVGRAAIQVTKKFVPYLPWTLVSGKMNRTNATAIFGRDVGTVRLHNCKTRREYLTDGSRTQEVSLSFEWREYPWGSYPRPDDGTFDFIVNGAGDKPYKSAELNDLLSM